jgi:VIT1/CCC1 family predicted Fe2+/Mn2+ transporter
MVEQFKRACRLYQSKFSFGATSAIITNLALIAGLRTGEHAKISIIGGMLVIALADNIADSLGIHVFQESECLETKEIWLSTCTNFITRILVSLTFIIPVILLPIKLATFCSVIWGLLLMSILSFVIARNKGINPYTAIFEHISIASIIIVLSNFAGKLVISRFKL